MRHFFLSFCSKFCLEHRRIHSEIIRWLETQGVVHGHPQTCANWNPGRVRRRQPEKSPKLWSALRAQLGRKHSASGCRSIRVPELLVRLLPKPNSNSPATYSAALPESDGAFETFESEANWSFWRRITLLQRSSCPLEAASWRFLSRGLNAVPFRWSERQVKRTICDNFRAFWPFGTNAAYSRWRAGLLEQARSPWLMCRPQLRGHRIPSRQHNYAGAHRHPPVKVLDILIGQANAAGRHETADSWRLIGTVDAVFSIAQIHRARPERVRLAPSHEPGQVRLARDHLLGRDPVKTGAVSLWSAPARVDSPAAEPRPLCRHSVTR